MVQKAYPQLARLRVLSVVVYVVVAAIPSIEARGESEEAKLCAAAPQEGIDQVQAQQQWRNYGRACASQGGEFYSATKNTAHSIQRIQYDGGTPLAEFLRDVAAANTEPAVLVGVPVVTKAAERWEDDVYFRDTVLPPVLNRILELPRPWYVYSDDGLQLPGYDDGRVERKEPLPAVHLIEHANAQAAAGPGGMLPPFYYYSRDVADADCDRARADLHWMEQLQHDLDSSDGFRVSEHTQLWLAQPGVTTHTHYDVFNNFYMQLKGTKQFFLAPPSARQRLKVFPCTHQQARQSQLNFSYNGNMEAMGYIHDGDDLCGTAAAAAVAKEVVLKAGEVLFIPAYTFHQVHTLSFSGSINMFTSTGYSAMFRNLRGAGIPTALQTLDQSIEGSRHRVAVLAVFVRSVLRHATVLLADNTGLRQFLLDEMEHRYRDLEQESGGGCLIDVEERERCPKQAVLSGKALLEIETIATVVSTVLLSQREGSTATHDNNNNNNNNDDDDDDDDDYHVSVVKLLAADYIEDLAAGVLGAKRVCLFLKCLASHGSWIIQEMH